MEDKTIKVRGMFGQHCERAIIDAFNKIGNIEKISVSLKYGTIAFSHNPQLAPLEIIINAIIDEGYDVIG